MPWSRATSSGGSRPGSSSRATSCPRSPSCPAAAAPTSSLPYYLADFAGPARLDGGRRPARVRACPAMTASVPGPVTGLPEIDAATVAAALRAAVDDPSPATPDEWMPCWLARQYRDGSVCSVGAVSPLASASYLLAKATSAPSLTLITNGGCYIDVEPRPVLFGSRRVARLLLSAHDHGRRGKLRVVLSGGPGLVRGRQRRADRRLRPDQQSRGLTPSGRGSCGCPARAAWPMSRTCTATSSSTCRASRRSTRPSGSSFSTAARGLLAAADREAAGYRPGVVVLVTNLAVFRLDDARWSVPSRGGLPVDDVR